QQRNAFELLQLEVVLLLALLFNHSGHWHERDIGWAGFLKFLKLCNRDIRSFKADALWSFQCFQKVWAYPALNQGFDIRYFFSDLSGVPTIGGHYRREILAQQQRAIGTRKARQVAHVSQVSNDNCSDTRRCHSCHQRAAPLTKARTCQAHNCYSSFSLMSSPCRYTPAMIHLVCTPDQYQRPTCGVCCPLLCSLAA